MANVKQAVGVNGHFVGSAYPDPGGDYSTDHATVIGQDAAVTRFWPLDTLSDDRFDEVLSLVTLAAQDNGPFPPNQLLVLTRKQTRLYAFTIELSPSIFSVGKCNNALQVDCKNESANEKLGACRSFAMCLQENLSPKNQEKVVSLSKAALDSIVLGDER